MAPLPMELVVEDQRRCWVAVESFISGGYIWKRDPVLSVGLQRDDVLLRVTFFIYESPHAQTQRAAEELFAAGKKRLAGICAAVPGLDAVLGRGPREYALHLDYGNGSVRLCYERDGHYRWT